jgi:hypothetical protein
MAKRHTRPQTLTGPWRWILAQRYAQKYGASLDRGRKISSNQPHNPCSLWLPGILVR